MSVKFNQSVAKMPELFKVLESKPFLTRDNLGDIGKDPEKVHQEGVYVFYDNGKAIYVGRSNRLKTRLKEHSQEGFNRSATLAIRMAKKNMPTLQNEERKPSVGQLIKKNSVFREKFKAAKDKIAGMEIRCVEIPDQIEQAMFEMYAILELNTEFNDFKNT